MTAGLTHELVVVDPTTGRILQHVPLPSDNNKSLASEPVSTGILEPDEKAQISYTGLSFFAGRLSNLPRKRQRRHQSLLCSVRLQSRRSVFLCTAAIQAQDAITEPVQSWFRMN